MTLSYYNQISASVQSELVEYLERINEDFTTKYRWSDLQISQIQCYRKQYDSLLVNDINNPIPRFELLTKEYIINCLALIWIEYQLEYLELDGFGIKMQNNQASMQVLRLPCDFNNPRYS
jgi:hypothetical protein